MVRELSEMIQNARRELRLASGLPLTADEQAAEDRKKQVDEMFQFAAGKFRLRLISLLNETILWTDKGAAVQFELEKHIFQVRKQGEDIYALFELDGTAERELFSASGEDPQFSNRVLVAVADAMSSSR